jgi:hypothetical protein
MTGSLLKSVKFMACASQKAKSPSYLYKIAFQFCMLQNGKKTNAVKLLAKLNLTQS